MPEMEQKKHVEKIIMAKLEAPGIKQWDVMTVWKKKKKNIRRFIGKMLLGSKILLFNNIFHRDPLNFPKIETDALTYL